MSRTDARNKAFHLLFQLDFAMVDDREQVKNIFWEENQTDNQKDFEFINNAVDGVLKNMNEIDNLIDSVAKGWTTKRMSKVDLAILRLAVFEIKYCDDIPNSVAVNEAIKLAKKYTSDEPPGFIIGILGKIA